MMSDCRAILWDVGGTLVEFGCSLPEAVRRRFGGCGVDHCRLSDEQIERTHAEFLRPQEQWRTIKQERDAERDWIGELLGSESFDGGAIDRVARVMPRYFDHLRPVPGVMALLDELRSRGLSMAIVSNWAPSLPEFLDHHGFTAYFEPIVYSAQDGIHKPDHRIFRMALDGLGISADRAIFIGDNPELDIVPARSMGMRAINFDPSRKYQSRDAEDIRGLRELLFGMLEA